MYITDYYFLNARHYPNTRQRVEPTAPTEDSTYENPEQNQKGKRTFLEKRPNSQKIPEENFKSVGSILSIWV